MDYAVAKKTVFACLARHGKSLHFIPRGPENAYSSYFPVVNIHPALTAPSFAEPCDEEHLLERQDGEGGITNVFCSRSGLRVGAVVSDDTSPSGRRCDSMGNANYRVSRSMSALWPLEVLLGLNLLLPAFRRHMVTARVSFCAVVGLAENHEE